MKGDSGSTPAASGPDSAEVTLAGLRSRLAELRLEVLRLRASRRTLMALLEMESRQNRALEGRLERLRARLRWERTRSRARSGGVAAGDGH
jgi:predicted RNase H-like nuclease (RuvC/YqgF family)